MLLIFKTPDVLSFSYPKLPHDPNYIYADNKNLKIRTISMAELIDVRENRLVAEGWPSLKYTMRATYAADPNGFYLLQKELEDIASISIVKYLKNRFAYIGFYHVVPSMRGQGYGKLLIKQAMAYAKQKYRIHAFGLNCVENAVPMYEKYGFIKYTSDEFWRYIVPTMRSVIADNDHAPVIDPARLSDIFKYDMKILGEDRQEFLREFILKPATITVLSINNDQVNGFGIMSVREPAIPEPATSYKIGPLYADNTEVATNIVQKLIAMAREGSSIYLDTPGNNILAARVAEMLGFSKIGAQAKLFMGSAPDFAISHIFGYGSIAIGG